MDPSSETETQTQPRQTQLEQWINRPQLGPDQLWSMLTPAQRQQTTRLLVVMCHTLIQSQQEVKRDTA